MKLTPETINAIMCILVPLVGWIMKRLGSRVPEAWTRFITALDPEDIDEAVTAVGTKTGRENLARVKVRDIADKYKVPMTDKELDAVMLWLGRSWKAGVKFASQRVGK